MGGFGKLIKLSKSDPSNKAKELEIKRLKKELAEKMQELEEKIKNAETVEERERLIALKHKITATEEEYKIEKLA